LLAYGVTRDILVDPKDPYPKGDNTNATMSLGSRVSYQFPKVGPSHGRLLEEADQNFGVVVCHVCRDRRGPKLTGGGLVDFVGPILRARIDGSVARVMPKPICFRATNSSFNTGMFEWVDFTDVPPPPQVLADYGIGPGLNEVIACDQ
jgi:hypothetical protein